MTSDMDGPAAGFNKKLWGNSSATSVRLARQSGRLRAAAGMVLSEQELPELIRPPKDINKETTLELVAGLDETAVYARFKQSRKTAPLSTLARMIFDISGAYYYEFGSALNTRCSFRGLAELR